MIPVPGVPSRPLQYLRAVRESDLPTGARAVCWALASFANNNTGKAYPAVKTLADATGESAPIVSKYTQLAEERGYLHKDRRHNGSIIYTITIPVTDEKLVILDDEVFPIEPPFGEETSSLTQPAPMENDGTQAPEHAWGTQWSSSQPYPGFQSTWDHENVAP